VRVAVGVDVDPVDRAGVELRAPACMGAGAGAVGFELMISTIVSGSWEDLNKNTSVKSSRRSSPGDLR
jgi:hypothetical protein